jgi:hypothetical protein
MFWLVVIHLLAKELSDLWLTETLFLLFWCNCSNVMEHLRIVSLLNSIYTWKNYCYEIIRTEPHMFTCGMVQLCLHFTHCINIVLTFNTLWQVKMNSPYICGSFLWACKWVSIYIEFGLNWTWWCSDVCDSGICRPRNNWIVSWFIEFLSS